MIPEGIVATKKQYPQRHGSHENGFFNPLGHAANGTVYSTMGCKHDWVRHACNSFKFYEFLHVWHYCDAYWTEKGLCTMVNYSHDPPPSNEHKRKSSARGVDRHEPPHTAGGSWWSTPLEEGRWLQKECASRTRDRRRLNIHSEEVTGTKIYKKQRLFLSHTEQSHTHTHWYSICVNGFIHGPQKCTWTKKL